MTDVELCVNYKMLRQTCCDEGQFAHCRTTWDRARQLCKKMRKMLQMPDMVYAPWNAHYRPLLRHSFEYFTSLIHHV